jgi:hypothetical protein
MLTYLTGLESYPTAKRTRHNNYRVRPAVMPDAVKQITGKRLSCYFCLTRDGRGLSNSVISSGSIT